MRHLIIALTLSAGLAWGQIPGSRVSGRVSDSAKLAGKPPCTATVTTGCVPNVDGDGNQVGGGTTVGLGTTSATFQIDSSNSGPKLKNESGTLVIRNAADDAYAALKALSVTAGDGTAQAAIILPELAANGTNDFRIYGAADQSADGCIVVSGSPTNGQVLKGTGTTATIDGKTCVVMEWAAASSSGVDPSDPNLFILKDDFPSTRPETDPTGELKWNSYGTPTLGKIVVAGHPGVRTVTTGAVSGNAAALAIAYGGTQTFNSLGTNMPFTSWSAHNIVSVPAETGYCFAMSQVPGETCAGDSTSENGVSIQFDTTAKTCSAGDAWSTTNWMFVVTGSVSTRCVDTGVAFAAGTWYHLVLSSDTAGTVKASINGSTPVANPATLANLAVTPHLKAVARSAGAKTVDIDFFSFKGALSR